MNHADAYGLSASGVSFDLEKVVKRSRAVSKQLNGGVGHLLKKNKVTVLDGEGKLNGPGKLKVTKDGKPVADLTAKHIILATGARARSLPGLEPDGKLVWTYMEALVPDIMPKSMLVIGSGAIGIEFASFFRTMGAEVTVVEVMHQILPVEDEEIAAHARKRFEKQGMKIISGAKVTALKKAANSVTVSVEDAKVARPAKSPWTRDLGGRRGRQHRGTSAWRPPRSRPIGAASSPTSSYARPSPASMPSATWPDRPCWPTRPSTRG